MQKQILTSIILLLILGNFPAFSQQRYIHFPWTYDRTVSAGTGAEGTAFTLLAQSRTDTFSLYSALALPIAPIRGAVGAYYHQHASANTQLVDFGVSYTAYIPFTDKANLRLGVQQNWHRTLLTSPADTWSGQPVSTTRSTDFSAFIRRDNLLFGGSMENALNKGQRQYNMLLGFRELLTYSWLRSSPFLLVQVRDGRDVPEFRFNYTVTAFNTVTIGGSAYKNSYYSWGANVGLKLFKALWLTAGAGFKDYNAQPDVLEVGLRLNVGKGRFKSSADEAVSLAPLPDDGL